MLDADDAGTAMQEGGSESHESEPQISQMAQIRTEGCSALPNERSERAEGNRKDGKGGERVQSGPEMWGDTALGSSAAVRESNGS